MSFVIIPNHFVRAPQHDGYCLPEEPDHRRSGRGNQHLHADPQCSDDRILPEKLWHKNRQSRRLETIVTGSISLHGQAMQAFF